MCADIRHGTYKEKPESKAESCVVRLEFKESAWIRDFKTADPQMKNCKWTDTDNFKVYPKCSF